MARRKRQELNEKTEAEAPARPTWRLELLCLLLLAGGIFLAFADVLRPDRGLYFRDHLGVFRPLWWFVREDLLAGHLPALTRYSPAGVPAELSFASTIYTPLTLIVLLGDFDTSYDLFVIAHFLVLGAGTFALARRLGATPWEALLAAAIMTLSGPVLSQENLITSLSGLCFTPWILWALDRLLEEASLRRLALVALFIGFHLQGLIPTFLLLDLAAGVLLLVFRKDRLTRAAAPWLAAAAVLGFFLAAIDVMPILEILPQTQRGAGWEYSDLATWPVTPYRLLELFVPSLWAPPEYPFAIVQEALGSDRTPYYLSLYCGPVLAFIIAGRSSRWRSGLLAGLVLSILIATGDLTPLHRLLTHLPLLSSERYPCKYLVPAVAFVAALAPLGLRALTVELRLSTALIFATLISLVIGARYLLRSDEMHTWLLGAMAETQATFSRVDRETQFRFLSQAMDARLSHVFFASMALALALVIQKLRRPELLACLVLADLALAGRFVVAGAPTGGEISEVERTAAAHDRDHWLYPAVRGGKPPPVNHIPTQTFFDDLSLAARARGYAPYRLLRLATDEDNDGEVPARAQLPFQLLPFARNDEEAQRLLARRGVGFIARPEGLERDPYFRPYVKLYTEWRAIEPMKMGREELLDLFTRPDLWDSALIFGPDSEATHTSTRACTGTSTAAVVARPHEGRVELESRGDCEAILVLLEPQMPGWTVEVDHREQPILPAEPGFMGVHLSPGPHRILFEYHPRVRWAWTSLGTLGIVLSMLAFGRRRTR